MKGGTKKIPGHPGMWAVLTVLAFPIVLITANIVGFDGASSFLLALASTFFVLLLEALVRGRIWIFEEGFIDHIGHPELPARLILVVGSTLLILETALIFVVATDRRVDPALLGIILRKACNATHDPSAGRLCKFLQEPTDMDGAHLKAVFNPTTFAVRETAARTWFPGDPLVTCANRTLKQTVMTGSRLHLGAVHCTSWSIDAQGTLRAQKSTTKFVEAQVIQEPSGFMRSVSWSENPTSRNDDVSLTLTPELVTILQGEALGRAQSRIR